MVAGAEKTASGVGDSFWVSALRAGWIKPGVTERVEPRE